jgi:hypothetical protein
MKFFESCIVLLMILTAPLAAPASPQTADPATGRNFDGPAELPREYVKSSMKDTPAPGKTLTAHPGQNLEQVLAKASCGDTVQLEAGATFTGGLVLPEKNCTDSRWIIVRTSASDSSLPAEGTRLTPCYAGVSSLPGRPPLDCKSTTNVLAKIEFNGKAGSGPIAFSSGANHYRLIGLEVTRAESAGSLYNLIQFKGPADHVIFDRLWVHGTARDETARGIGLGPSRYVAIVDSYFSDFHCVAKTGACVDSQAILGGLGDSPMGPYRIVNNFLEAAAEVILFGGGRAVAAPADIEVRRNHMFRPMSWKSGDPHFVSGRDGNPFIVKNVFELKNAQRVLLEGNILENSWGGFSQAGFAVLLTPKNQNNLCPNCLVTDVTIRYNRIAHTGSGMQIGNGRSDAGGMATDGGRYSIHDVLFEDIGGPVYDGLGVFAQISASGPPLHDLKLDHITAFPPKFLFMFGVRGGMPKTSHFVFTNNVIGTGDQLVLSTGGGAENCAFQPERQGFMGVLKSCFSDFTVEHNLFAGRGTGWPKENRIVGSPQAVGFAAVQKDAVADYHLRPDSIARRAGTDGKDLGVDLDTLSGAIDGVP